MYQTGNGEKFLHFQVLQLCCWNHGNSHVSNRRHFWVLGLALAGGTVAAEGVAIAVPWQDQLLAGRQGSCSALWAHRAKVWAGQSQSPRSCSHLPLQQQLRLLKETTLLTAVCKSNRWFLQIPALPITFITSSSSCPLPIAVSASWYCTAWQTNVVDYYNKKAEQYLSLLLKSTTGCV